MTSSARVPSQRLSVLLLGLLLLLTFWLPTRIAAPVANSDSFCFGFNNHAFQALLLLTLAVAALLAYRHRLRLPLLPEAATQFEDGPSRRLLIACLVFSAALCGVMCWLSAPLGGINDSVYFLDRIHLMQRGLVPVRDFEFIYGTGPLYVPVLLARVLPLTADAAYFALWTAATLLGVYLLWLSIRWLDLPSAGKRGIFLAVYLLMTLLIVDAAINYCALRYTLPLFGLAGLERLDRGSHRRVAVVLFAVAITALLLAYSPEEGLVYAIAACLFLPLRRHLAGRPWLPDLAALLACCASLCLLFARLGTFVTMRRLGAGAFNLPVYPGPHILLAVAALLLLVITLASAARRQSLSSGLAACALYSLGMVPGAFGRCDTIHIAGYLLPALVCAMLLIAPQRSLRRASITAFVLVFCLCPFLIAQWQTPPVLSKAFLFHIYRNGRPQAGIAHRIDGLAETLAERVLGQQRGATKMAALRNSSSAASVDPRLVFPGASSALAVPFEYMPTKQGNYQAAWIDEGYFMGTLNVLTPQDVARKVQELTSHPAEDLVVSTDGFDQCGELGGSRRDMRSLLLLPWVPAPRRRVTLLVPFCTFLHEQYQFVVPPTPATFGYGLMRRRGLF